MSVMQVCDDFCHFDWDYCNSRYCGSEFYDCYPAHSRWPCHQWCHRRCLATKVSLTDEGFQVRIDVKHFNRNDITVKTVDDVIVIEGKRKDKGDPYVCITRQFVRKFKLPKGYDPSEVVSSLSSDGILIVKAPAPAKKPQIHERSIPIQEMGPVLTDCNENKEEKAGPSDGCTKEK